MLPKYYLGNYPKVFFTFYLFFCILFLKLSHLCLLSIYTTLPICAYFIVYYICKYYHLPSSWHLEIYLIIYFIISIVVSSIFIIALNAKTKLLAKRKQKINKNIDIEILILSSKPTKRTQISNNISVPIQSFYFFFYY